MNIFGFHIEFDHDALRQKINTCCKELCKGYICVVDGPSLARSYQNPDFMHLLQDAYANTCDGSSIAFMASKLYKQELKAFTGPEIFAEYIVQEKYNQVLLGNTEEMFLKVQNKVASEGHGTDHMYYIPLPFATVEDFDYEGIARQIESLNADIIWVSLGAPKQEYFMRLMLPHLKQGVMLGVGAAFAFYLGELKDYSFRIGENRLNWIYRLYTEPKKQFRRVGTILKCYPAIYFREYKKIRKEKQ